VGGGARQDWLLQRSTRGTRNLPAQRTTSASFVNPIREEEDGRFAAMIIDAPSGTVLLK
jgi:hypothetical protein